MLENFEIKNYMTPMPYVIKKDASIQEALGFMRKNQISHLPVVENETLLGLVTDRDIKLAATFDGAENMTVEEVMVLQPYRVHPTSRLSAVALSMAEHDIGCALVEDKGKIVGIFTTQDALRVLGEKIREEEGLAA